MPALSVTPGRFPSCSSNGPHPSQHTPAPPPYQTIPLGGGGLGTPDAIYIYIYIYIYVYIYIYIFLKSEPYIPLLLAYRYLGCFGIRITLQSE